MTYVDLTWADDDKLGGLAMQCDRNACRGVLAALEVCREKDCELRHDEPQELGDNFESCRAHQVFNDLRKRILVSDVG